MDVRSYHSKTPTTFLNAFRPREYADKDQGQIRISKPCRGTWLSFSFVDRRRPRCRVAVRVREDAVPPHAVSYCRLGL